MGSKWMHEHARLRLEESIQVKQGMISDGLSTIVAIAQHVTEALRRGGKIVLCGNGGSAADSQHIAGELVGCFLLDRSALAAIALTTDSSILTCIGNDLGFDQVFARQAEALVSEHDVFVAISTSGDSMNVLEGARVAHSKGALVVGLTGCQGGQLKALADLCLCVPSDETPRVQECHVAALHVVCELVELALFGEERT